MAQGPAISVIIPVYNVQAWIQRAVSSLQQQTFADFEVILVNDGSTDGSGAVCDRLAAEDKRIRVLHRENGGAARARNMAIDQAAGDFLYFMDGDDWCEPTMLEDLHRFAIEKKLDLAVTGFYIDTYYAENKFYREERTAPDETYSNQNDFRIHAHKLFDAQLLYAPWNKLYRRSYLKEHHIVFPETFWDDLPFNLEVIRNIEHVGCLNGHYYHFLRARAESENTKYRANMYQKREEEHQWLCDLYRQWGLDSPAIQEFLARRYAERLVGCIENVTNKNCTLTSAEKRAEIERMISTPHAKEALGKARPSSIIMRATLSPLRQGNARLSMWEGAFISFVRRHSTNLFARLKANGR